MSLWSDFLTNDRRALFKFKHYFTVYEHHFRRFVDRDVVFFEIGVGQGGSAQMWKRYFGPHARIIGIDADPTRVKVAEDQIEIRIGSQADPDFLKSLVAEFGPPDVVLDDGSHLMEHVHASFRTLYPILKTNGVYMVEDLNTAYWPKFGGGLGTSGSFIETSKHLIDELNADAIGDAAYRTDFSRTTLSMHFYESMVVFEKGRHTLKMAMQTGVSEEPIG